MSVFTNTYFLSFPFVESATSVIGYSRRRRSTTMRLEGWIVARMRPVQSIRCTVGGLCPTRTWTVCTSRNMRHTRSRAFPVSPVACLCVSNTVDLSLLSSDAAVLYNIVHTADLRSEVRLHSAAYVADCTVLQIAQSCTCIRLHSAACVADCTVLHM